MNESFTKYSFFIRIYYNFFSIERIQRNCRISLSICIEERVSLWDNGKMRIFQNNFRLYFFWPIIQQALVKLMLHIFGAWKLSFCLFLFGRSVFNRHTKNCHSLFHHFTCIVCKTANTHTPQMRDSKNKCIYELYVDSR